jgi:hypothetical protein
MRGHRKIGLVTDRSPVARFPSRASHGTKVDEEKEKSKREREREEERKRKQETENLEGCIIDAHTFANAEETCRFVREN